jgi:hypothetical protein
LLAIIILSLSSHINAFTYTNMLPSLVQELGQRCGPDLHVLVRTRKHTMQSLAQTKQSGDGRKLQQSSIVPRASLKLTAPLRALQVASLHPVQFSSLYTFSKRNHPALSS